MTIDWRHTGLCIDGVEYSASQLRHHAETVLADRNSPQWYMEIWQFILDWTSEDDHIVQHSSGTTGAKKELLLPKSVMIRSAINTLDHFGLQQGQKALLLLPMRYIAGKMMVVRAFLGGINLLCAEPRANPDLAEYGRIDFSAMVPLQVFHLLESGIFPQIRQLIIGGAEISPELISMVKDLPSEVYATYGMAETASHIALRRLNGAQGSGSYHLLPGISIETDPRGCLIIHANYLEEQIITNDLVELTGEAQFRWKGRFDNLINSGGVKVIPEEVEEKVLEMTGNRTILLGLPDKILGQRIIMAIESAPDSTKEEELGKALQHILPRHLIPKSFSFIPQFPRNESFKVNRHELTRMLKMA